MVNQILFFGPAFYFCPMAHFLLQSEENYLKTIYSLASRDMKVNNVTLSKALQLNPATVLEMIRKLVDKKLVAMEAGKTISLTGKGEKKALQIVRRHRLWEVFLVEKLGYAWNEVHDIAEQLEHIESADLVDKLDVFLNHPAVDPHGDPIPDKTGKITRPATEPLSEGEPGQTYRVLRFADTSDSFLDYLDKLQIAPGKKIKLVEQHAYDESWEALVGKTPVSISAKAAANILVQPA